MRIAVASDLHVEHRNHRLQIPLPEVDVWILAGDIGTGVEAVYWIYETLPTGVPVFYVTGNHEFYGTRPVEVERAYMAELAEELGVTLLENDEVVTTVAGRSLRVLGCTLWTDFDLFGRGNRATAMENAKSMMNDFRLIRSSEALLEPSVTRAWHLESRRFLEHALSKPFDGKTIVVTHHAPVREAARLDGEDTVLSPAFGSDMRAFVEGCGADIWVFGHTHTDWDEMVGKTRLVSRQGGYPRSGNRPAEREMRGLPPFEPLVVTL